MSRTDDRNMDRRLENWGRCMRGGLPECSNSYFEPEGRPTLDELDAARIEAALVILRRRRPVLYRLARLMYLRGSPMLVLCQAFRCSDTRVYEMRKQLFVAVEGILEGMAHRDKFAASTI